MGIAGSADPAFFSTDRDLFMKVVWNATGRSLKFKDAVSPEIDQERMQGKRPVRKPPDGCNRIRTLSGGGGWGEGAGGACVLRLQELRCGGRVPPMTTSPRTRWEEGVWLGHGKFGEKTLIIAACLEQLPGPTANSLQRKPPTSTFKLAHCKVGKNDSVHYFLTLSCLTLSACSEALETRRSFLTIISKLPALRRLVEPNSILFNRSIQADLDVGPSPSRSNPTSVVDAMSEHETRTECGGGRSTAPTPAPPSKPKIRLPTELLFKIFKALRKCGNRVHLSSDDLLACSRVCRRWGPSTSLVFWDHVVLTSAAAVWKFIKGSRISSRGLPDETELASVVRVLESHDIFWLDSGLEREFAWFAPRLQGLRALQTNPQEDIGCIAPPPIFILSVILTRCPLLVAFSVELGGDQDKLLVGSVGAPHVEVTIFYGWFVPVINTLPNLEMLSIGGHQHQFLATLVVVRPPLRYIEICTWGLINMNETIGSLLRAWPSITHFRFTWKGVDDETFALLESHPPLTFLACRTESLWTAFTTPALQRLLSARGSNPQYLDLCLIGQVDRQLTTCIAANSANSPRLEVLKVLRPNSRESRIPRRSQAGMPNYSLLKSASGKAGDPVTPFLANLGIVVSCGDIHIPRIPIERYSGSK
ncbi:hypothetical protein BDK51DRAFT_44619 [Blyttiomyces helicus]|uniref:F-box domain-containing protein n=1 Tax=Blyttiomyces helicus TaxID=388810 RepID=A0A4P9WA46_9FUNG|nr:hypothetical protein BDK51DRAFT_44619 [Blyttiomyces helicus]|eukprot:RKO89294.1 hypothetical protein BDK51DRAFT_44619 [Blyttiomyces helicus]